jgi:hypothetical protein
LKYRFFYFFFFGAQADVLAGSDAVVPARKRTLGRGACSLLRQHAAVHCFFHLKGITFIQGYTGLTQHILLLSTQDWQMGER